MITLGLVDVKSKFSPKHKSNLTSNQKRALFESQVGQCLLCGAAGIVLEAHHVYKVEHDGSDDAYNLMGVCRRCHGIINRSYFHLNPIARIALALQVLAPESMLVALACRALFEAFQKSRICFWRYRSLRLLPIRSADQREREAA
jgi:hypothetical protein